jgi:hypothetical protein
MVLVIAIAMGGIVSVALPIVFHYPKASDATSVLGEVLPIFTALLGAALGTGVGNATGAAGKKAVEGQLSQTKQALRSVNSELPELTTHVGNVFSQLRNGLQSPAGQARFFAVGVAGGEPTAEVDIESMDRVTASLARIQALVDVANTLE